MVDDTVKLPQITRSPDTPLTAIAERFVEHWLRYRNATNAYKHATENPTCAYMTAAQEGAKLLRDERVQEAIRARCKSSIDKTAIDVAWLLQRFADVATADPRELIGLKVGCCRYCYGEGHGYQWREREYMERLDEAERLARDNVKGVLFPDIGGGFGFNATWPPVDDCPQCHGEGVERFVPRDTDNLSDQALLLYGGVKVKKDGYEIIIADRQKALEQTGRILGAFNDKLQHSGAIGVMAAVADLRKIDPQEAARQYQDMIRGKLALT